jgi:hypothetical protein
MRRLTLLALVVVVVVAAGCGGAKPAGDAAELVPPSTLAFVSLDTDLGAVPRVLDRFPFGSSTLKAIRRALLLRPSMGPRLELAVFKSGTVSFVQPPDEKRFEATLRARELHARIRGWTVVTEQPALLDLVRHHEGRLADLPAYRDATKRLHRDAVVRAYAASGAAGLVTRRIPLGRARGLVPPKRSWVAAALSAKGDELRLELHTRGAKSAPARTTSDLASRIPAGSILAVGLGGGIGRVPGDLRVGGVDVQGIADALGGEAVAYVRAGLPFPEVTLASKPKDPQRAVRAVARLVRELGRPKAPPVPTTVDGVTLQDVVLGAIDIYYGTFDGMLVVSDSTAAVGALRSHGDKLKVPGLPDATNGFLYLDVEHALPAVKAFAKLANQTVPARLEADVKPLKTLVLYGTRDGDVQTVVAVLQTR